VPYPHDLALAARELDDAGWRLRGSERYKDGRPLALGIALAASPADAARIAVIAQEQLTRLGAAVTVKGYPENLFSSPEGPLRTGRFNLTPAALIGGSDPEQSLNVLCAQASDGGENYSRYCSPALEAAFADQSQARDDARRRRDFDAIAAIVRDGVPLIPLYDLVYTEGIGARVTAYRRNMLRYPVRPQEWDVR
jgi:peptide/nickel transport system substrate-binding protein